MAVRRIRNATGEIGGPVQCVYVRRMPRIQVYLPDDLHRALKKRGLSGSELLQRAVRAELQQAQALVARVRPQPRRRAG